MFRTKTYQPAEFEELWVRTLSKDSRKSQLVLPVDLDMDYLTTGYVRPKPEPDETHRTKVRKRCRVGCNCNCSQGQRNRCKSAMQMRFGPNYASQYYLIEKLTT